MKEKESLFPVSSVEFDKIYRVMDKRNSMGYSDRELSFLLGYHSLYVRNVENPLHTLRYTTKDTNYLLSIFNCKLPEIMAGKIKEDFYRIKVDVRKYAGGITYKIYLDVSDEEQVLFKEFTSNAQENSDLVVDTEFISNVNGFVQIHFDNGYFETPRTALEVFKLCAEKFGHSFRPYLLSNAIGKYTFRRMSPRLVQEKNKSGRTIYKRE